MGCKEEFWLVGSHALMRYNLFPKTIDGVELAIGIDVELSFIANSVNIPITPEGRPTMD
jgi:hypothetical protein